MKLIHPESTLAMTPSRTYAFARSVTAMLTAVLMAAATASAWSIPALASSFDGATISPDAESQGPCTAVGEVNCPVASGDGYVYVYDPGTGSVVSIPTSEAGPRDPDAVYAYSVSPDCPGALPRDAINCTEAAQYCAANGQSGVHEDVWRSEISPVWQDWTIVGHVCTGSGGVATPVDQVIQDVGEYERDHMPIPTANVQPAGVAIVNLPVLVSATPLGPQTMQVQQPVPGELVATPTYTWTFDDGGAATGPGTPYDGTDPRADPAHYALHIYRAANEHASVTLTVTWNATFSVAGQTFPIPQLVMPPITTTFSVREAHSVLVSG